MSDRNQTGFACDVRRATVADAVRLAEMRATSSYERKGGDIDRRDAYARACAEFFASELARSESFLRSWVALVDGHVVGGASLTVLPTLPRYGASFSGFDGRVRDVYVDADFRRRGIARALMAAVVEAAKGERIDRLTLGASDMGAPLYLSLGFEYKRDEMVFISD